MSTVRLGPALGTLQQGIPTRASRLVSADQSGSNLTLSSIFALAQLTDFINTSNADAGSVLTWTGSAFDLSVFTGGSGSVGNIPRFRIGAGAPTGAIGQDNDLYINNLTSDMYGPKTAGVWGPVVATLRGLQGPIGPAGTAGVNGTPGTLIFSADGPPSNAIGSNGDFYINQLTGDYYKKSSGTFAIIFNVNGPAIPSKNLLGNPTGSQATARAIALGPTLDIVNSVLGIKAGAVIPLDPSGTRTISWDANSQRFFINSPNGQGVVQIDDDGNITANSVNDDTALLMSLGLAGQWMYARGMSSAPAWVNPPFIDANDPRFQNGGDGVRDDGDGLQGAADAVPDSGGVVLFTRLHATSRPIFLKPNTTAIFWGSKFIAHQNWPVPTSSDFLVDPGYCFISNRNYTASGLADNNISVIGFVGDWTALQTARGTLPNATGVRFRKVIAPTVEHARIYAGGYGATFHGCNGARSLFNGFLNNTTAGVGFFEGCVDGQVAGCNFAIPAVAGAIGCLFKGTDARGNSGFIASKLRVTQCDFVGPTGAAANAADSAIKFDAGSGCTITASSAVLNSIDGKGALTNGIAGTANGTVSWLNIGPTNQILATSRTTGKDIILTCSDSVIGGNKSDHPSGFAASISITGARNSVWGYDINGDTVFVGNVRAANIA